MIIFPGAQPVVSTTTIDCPLQLCPRHSCPRLLCGFLGHWTCHSGLTANLTSAPWPMGPSRCPPAVPEPNECVHPADISPTPPHQRLPKPAGLHWAPPASPTEPSRRPPPPVSHGAAGSTPPSGTERPRPRPAVTPPLSPDLRAFGAVSPR